MIKYYEFGFPQRSQNVRLKDFWKWWYLGIAKSRWLHIFTIIIPILYFEINLFSQGYANNKPKSFWKLSVDIFMPGELIGIQVTCTLPFYKRWTKNND